MAHNNLNTRRTAPMSVFEATYDNTERENVESNAQRWKFRGPWLAGKTEGEFDQYLGKTVKRRKFEFRTFIRGRLERERTFERRREAQESGEDLEGAVDASEQDVDSYMKQLRGDEVQLQMLIEEFLDLPIAADSNIAEGAFVTMMDSDRGPPTTHLSAGLSYLRTGSHMTNHPVLGPMEEEPPIQARILRPQVSGVVRHASAMLGVGGVAAEDSTKATAYKSTVRGRQEVPGIQKFEPDIEGGAKIWIRPDRASIDVHGRPKVHVLRVEPREEAIYEGVVEEEMEVGSGRRPFNPGFKTMPKLDAMRRMSSGKSSNYGLGRENSGQGSRRATPLDVPNGSENSRQSILDLLESEGNR